MVHGSTRCWRSLDTPCLTPSHTIMLNGSRFSKQWRRCENVLLIPLFFSYKQDCVWAGDSFTLRSIRSCVYCDCLQSTEALWIRPACWKNEFEILHTPSCAPSNTGSEGVGGGEAGWLAFLCGHTGEKQCFNFAFLSRSPHVLLHMGK